MRRRAARAVGVGAAIAVFVVGAASARAQFSAEAVTSGPPEGAGDATAAATRVPLDARAPVAETLADVLREVPGARALGTGGRGAFTGLSLRGADVDQTRVYLGDLPLDGPDTGAFDLSTLPLGAFEAVEVARGAAPAWWSDGAIGGVLRLTPRRAAGGHVTLYGGSFGLAGLAASAAVAPGPDAVGPTVATSVQVERATNDFPYADDGLTPLDPSDDVERPRRNADVFDATALVTASTPAGAHGAVEATMLGLVREAGAPGPGGRDTLHTRQSLTRLVGSVAYRLLAPSGHRLAIVAGGGDERRALDDPLAELGGLTAADDRIRRGFARVAVSLPVAPWLEWSSVATYRHDVFAPSDDAPAGAGALGPGRRHTAAAAAEARAHGALGGVDVEVRPSARLEVSRTETARPGSEQETRTEDVLAPTARLGLAVAPDRDLRFVASVGSGVRLPSLVELFGNRTFLLGEPGLAPERATNLDVGAEGHARVGALRLVGEVRGFARFERDAIVLTQSTDGWLRPENVGAARALGLEARLDARLAHHARLLVTTLVLDARETTLDARLPYRPRATGYVRLEGRTPGTGVLVTVRPWVDVAVVGETTVNLAELGVLPARAQVGAGLRVELDGGRWEVGASAHDVFDQRGPDLLGFPLPGRRFEAAVTWHGDR